MEEHEAEMARGRAYGIAVAEQPVPWFSHLA